MTYSLKINRWLTKWLAVDINIVTAHAQCSTASALMFLYCFILIRGSWKDLWRFDKRRTYRWQLWIRAVVVDLPQQEDGPSFDRPYDVSSYGPVVSSRFSSRQRRSRGRTSQFLWDIQPQLFSGFRRRGAVRGLDNRLQYQRRGDDHLTSTSRHKKLKSDMFYAVRGRRRYDVINDNNGDDDDDDRTLARWQPELETLVGNSMTASYFPAGRIKNPYERTPAAASRHRQLQTLAAERALRELNEVERGNHSWVIN